MNTDTGNIFAILNNEPLAENEVELTAEQFRKLIPIRALPDRLEMYRRMQDAMNPANDARVSVNDLSLTTRYVE